MDDCNVNLNDRTGCEALDKAQVDRWQFVAKLRTGEMVFFEHATRTGPDWVHLELWETSAGWLDDRAGVREVVPFGDHRGIDVRISDIVWVVDSPFGT